MTNLQMSSMPPVRYVSTNGIRMAVYEAGFATAPTVVLLHGFPELAFSWRHQLPALVAAGYRVIAPDLRGYGLTDRPEQVEAYALDQLLGDLIGLLDELHVPEAIWMGHDWGGILAWQLPLFHPKRTVGVISVNTPFVPHWRLWLHPEQIGNLMPPGFTPTSERDPMDQMREVYSPDMYVLTFHDGDDADRLLKRDVRRTFQTIMRKNIITAGQYQQLPPERRQMNLFLRLEGPELNEMRGESILSSDELDIYVQTFDQTGFTPGINWYRNISRNWQAGREVEQTIHAPSLMICAADDVVLMPGMIEGMNDYVDDLEVQTIPDCGHWTQQQKPADLNALVIAWLQKRFPVG